MTSEAMSVLFMTGIALACSASIALTVQHFYLRLCRPWAVTLDDVVFPTDRFQFVEMARTINAFAVTGYSFWRGAYALLFWAPSEDLRVYVAIMLGFFGSLGLVVGLDRLSRRAREAPPPS